MPKAKQPPQPAPKSVKVSEAKGRPMLSWVGKRPLGVVKAFPAQQVETFNAAPNAKTPKRDDWPANYAEGGLLFHGDNKEVLAHLLANGFRGKVQLIYIDPPFDSNADYVRKVSLRGPKGTTKVDGETYSLGEQIQYTDIWANDNYLQFMYERMLLLKELLTAGGYLFLHCDARRSHLLRTILDEVMGPAAFRSEVIRIKCNPKNSKRKAFGNIHDVVLMYVNGSDDGQFWDPQREDKDSADLERIFDQADKEGRRYTTVALHAKGERKGAETGRPWRGIFPPPGRHWANRHSELDRLLHAGRIEFSGTQNPRLIRYADENEGDLVQDVWTMKDPVEDEYPTEKPLELLERIIRVASRPGEVILDCFTGSGTTAAMAQQLGRRWIGCDINKGAIQTTAKRLQGVMEEQASEAAMTKQHKLLPDDTKDAAPLPAQLSFTTWRVNNYDLQIQHNEARALALEYLGVERTKTDSFFDGTLGKALVKMIAFDHPLSPLDLEQIKQELEARKDEDRSIKVVCLGMELAAQAWVDDWNRLRKGKATANRIDVVELRDDEAHGGWMNHTPAEADVSITRKKDRILVDVKNFISPAIVDRLKRQAGVLTPKIDDFRAMIDSVAIDTAYDGTVFNVVSVDVPEKKTDMVAAKYDLAAPKGETTVAVRITDMLGEEVLVTKIV